MKIVKEKSFYKSVLAITIPIALQNLISVALSLMDTVMLGRADSEGILLSASSLANQPFFLLNVITFGISGAATVLLSQYWGKRDMSSIKTILSMVMKIAFGFSILAGLIVLLFPKGVLSLYSNNELIIESGAKYLKIIGYAYFVYGVTNTTICAIRSVEIVKISVVVNITSFLINVVLNWILIFGKLGAPAMGIEGAALATLIARIMEFVIISVYILVIDKRICFKFRDLIRFNKVLFIDLIRYGAPVAIVEILWSLGITVQAAVLGHINYAKGDPVAANAIMSVVQQLSTIVIFGVSNAAAVLVGKSIGENDIEGTVLRANTFKYIFLLVGVLAGVVILLARNVAVGFYTVPPETKHLAKQMMNVMAFQSVFIAISNGALVGTLRGAGDTKFCLFADMLTIWGVSIPLAFISAFVLKLSVPMVLICMKADEFIKFFVCMHRMNGTKWLNSVTRDFEN